MNHLRRGADRSCVYEETWGAGTMSDLELAGLLLCDECGKLYHDDHAALSESCDVCGRFKQRMDGATASNVLKAIESKDREIERLRKALREVQWLDHTGGTSGLLHCYCSGCGTPHSHKHADDCPVENALKQGVVSTK